MKPFLKLFFFAVLVLALPACAQPITSPAEANMSGSKIQPSHAKKLDSIYLTSPKYPDVSAGFVIDSDDVNHPAVAISGENSGIWIFPEAVQSIFKLDKRLAANDASGNIYVLNYPNWIVSSVKLRPLSHVLSSRFGIIACTKPVRLKQRGDRGDCYSLSAGWNFAFDLQAAPPAVCGNYLRLISREESGHVFKEIALDTGEVKSEAPTGLIHTSLCEIK